MQVRRRQVTMDNKPISEYSNKEVIALRKAVLWEMKRRSGLQFTMSGLETLLIQFDGEKNKRGL